jgi:hypothetical protein
MNKTEVVSLARELFKIRITSAREGRSQDDGVHRLTEEGITFYTRETIEKWYTEALETAEMVLMIEERYLQAKTSEA